MNLETGLTAAVLCLFAATNAVLILLAWRQGRRLRGQQASGEDLRRELEAVQREIGALCAGAAGAGARLSRVDQQLLRIFERQDRLELRDSMHREYDRAAKLIREGVGIEQVMTQCNLVRAEAELLMRMHGDTGIATPRDYRRSGTGMRASGSPM